MTELTVIACWLTGLMSTLHCVGMCGGITTLLAVKTADVDDRWSRLINILLYHSGRIFSYGMIGLLAGTVSQLSVGQLVFASGHSYLQWLSSIILIMIALHILGCLPALTVLERLALRLWRSLQKLLQCLLPAKSRLEIFTLGLIWGWLPCGLVYSILLLAVSSGDAVNSFVYMVAFGLGTLPGMLSLSLGGSVLSEKLKTPSLRKLSAMVIIVIALVTPFTHLWLGQHHGHSHDHHSSRHHHHSAPAATVHPGHHTVRC